MTEQLKRLWVLGASDPEMELIGRLLKGAEETFEYAEIDGRRVRPHEAYRTDPPHSTAERIITVECGGVDWSPDVVVDHHRPGDPGYGLPPEDFLGASSVGQVIGILAREVQQLPRQWRRMWAGSSAPLTPQVTSEGVEDWIGVPWLRVGRGGRDVIDVVEDASTFVRVPAAIVLAAAADHCPAAAYQGQCPGVDPEKLAAWRAQTRAEFQGRRPEDILADVANALGLIREGPRILLGGVRVVDLRSHGAEYIPELPEATLRSGECVLAEIPARPRAPGSVQVTLQGAGSGTAAGPAPIQEFLDSWAESEGYRGVYGDAARGFAGGYRQ